MASEKSLTELVSRWFPDLSQAERRFVAAASEAEIAFCGPSSATDKYRADKDPGNDTNNGATWSRRRSIRCELIQKLCVDASANRMITNFGLAIHGARITGSLNLVFAQIQFPLCFYHCYFDDDAFLANAKIPMLVFSACRLKAIDASHISVASTISLSDGCSVNGTVWLAAAQIGGSIDCSNSAFTPQPQVDNRGTANSVAPTALDISQSTVKHGIDLKNSTLAGITYLNGSELDGDLECSGATLQNPLQSGLDGSGIALNASYISVKGEVSLRRVRSSGTIYLDDARISGNLACDAAKFSNPWKSSETLRERLSDADPREIGIALSAARINTTTIFLRYGFKADGAVELRLAQLAGDLDCNRGSFTYEPLGDIDVDALFLNRAALRGSVFLNDATVIGSVEMSGTQVGSDVECNGTKVSKHFEMESASVKGSILLRNFQCEGLLSIRSCQISGPLTVQNSDLRKARVDLTATSIGSLDDDVGSWPKKGALSTDGFLYSRIDNLGDVDWRLHWLELNDHFVTQPYEQLAKVLKDAGRDDDAKRVLERMEWHRHTNGSYFQKSLGVLGRSIGFGYYSENALWGLLTLSAVGWIIYRRSYLAGNLTPTEKDVFEKFTSEGVTPNHYRHFSPLAFSAESSFPLIKLGQSDKWQARPQGPETDSEITARKIAESQKFPVRFKLLQRIAVAVGLAPRDSGRTTTRLSVIGTSSRFVKWFVWVQILLGWLLTTLFVAGVSGIFHKN